jgi:hypothetical protein
MRWPGIRDGIRRQEFFKGEGTTNTTRHHRVTPGRGATGTFAKGENHTGDQPASHPAYTRDDNDPHPHRTPRSHKTRRHAGAAPRLVEKPARGRLRSPRRFDRG